MANSSELLNFLSQDQKLNSQTLEAREQLSKCVQMAFTYLVHCLREILNQSMPALFQTARNSIEAPGICYVNLNSNKLWIDKKKCFNNGRFYLFLCLIAYIQ